MVSAMISFVANDKFRIGIQTVFQSSTIPGINPTIIGKKIKNIMWRKVEGVDHVSNVIKEEGWPSQLNTLQS